MRVIRLTNGRLVVDSPAKLKSGYRRFAEIKDHSVSDGVSVDHRRHPMSMPIAPFLTDPFQVL